MIQADSAKIDNSLGIFNISRGRNQQGVRLKGFKPAACFDIWLATFHIMEMLYDTPFPTEPQNDLVPAQTERNREIRARHEAGETGVSIAKAFDISGQRISQIVHGQRKWA